MKSRKKLEKEVDIWTDSLAEFEQSEFASKDLLSWVRAIIDKRKLERAQLILNKRKNRG